jgi:hypothetical protein
LRRAWRFARSGYKLNGLEQRDASVDRERRGVECIARLGQVRRAGRNRVSTRHRARARIQLDHAALVEASQRIVRGGLVVAARARQAGERVRRVVGQNLVQRVELLD